MNRGEALVPILHRLAERRKVFASERDFQIELGWEIRAGFPGAEVRPEWPVRGGGSAIALDLLTRWNGSRGGIELKYRTRAGTFDVDGETFELVTHGAEDAGRYLFLKDVERLDRCRADGVIDWGAAVLMTNEPRFWMPPTRPDVNDAYFRIDEDRSLSGSLSWGEGAAPGSIRGMEAPIELCHRVECRWRDFSAVSATSHGRFRFLLIQV